MSAHDFTFTAINGTPMPLAAYAGRPLLVVNTASKCGFTPQYKALQALSEQYRGRGLTVIGTPCNDFGGQEPAGEAEIAQFCELNFGVDFPLTRKLHVKGPEADPFYRWAGGEGGLLARPKWNFYKYLIGKDGQLLAWFSSLTKPDAPKLRAAVEAAL